VKVVTVCSWLNFGRTAPPGRGLQPGEIFWLRLIYYSQRAVFASQLPAFPINSSIYRAINHKEGFLLTHMQNEKRFGGKWEDVTSGQIDPKGTHPPQQHILWCTDRNSTPLGVCELWIWKNQKWYKSMRVHKHHPTPICSGHCTLSILCV